MEPDRCAATEAGSHLLGFGSDGPIRQVGEYPDSVQMGPLPA